MPPRQPQEGVITVTSSTAAQQADALEQQLQALSAALGARVAGAQADTLRRLQLLDAAAEGLEVRQAPAASVTVDCALHPACALDHHACDTPAFACAGVGARGIGAA